MSGKDGYIALIDVLGFEELIARETYREDLDRYTACIEALSSTSKLEYVLFSDTIVISSVDTSVSTFLDLVRSCSQLFGKLLKQGIPLRGAISRGSFIRQKNDAGVFLAGRAVVDAYHFEKKQDWVGIMFTPSVLREVPNLRNLCALPSPADGEISADQAKDWMRWVYPCASIPFHDGIYDGFALVPTDSVATSAGDIEGDLRLMLVALERLKSLAGDPHAQKKYAATQSWLAELWRYWRGFVDDLENIKEWVDDHKKGAIDGGG